MYKLNTDNIKLCNIIYINGIPYRVTSTTRVGNVVLSFKAVSLDKKSLIKMKKATS